MDYQPPTSLNSEGNPQILFYTVTLVVEHDLEKSLIKSDVAIEVKI